MGEFSQAIIANNAGWQVGDQLTVKVVEIDEKGRINLSHKATL